MEKLTSYYASRVEALSAVIARLKSKNRAYVAAELLTFGLAVAAVVLYCADGFLTAPLVAAVAMLAAYALVRRADVRNGRRIDANERLRSVYGKELKATAFAGNLLFNGLHWHSSLELLFCLKGKIRVRLEGNVLELEKCIDLLIE